MRTSWDTTLKIYARNNLLQTLSDDLILSIPRSNIHRWKNESETKYKDCGLSKIIREEIDFISKTREFPTVKKTAEAHIKIMECLYRITNKIKKYKTFVANAKTDIVDTIELVKNSIPINDAIKWFNISRATYHSYKTLVINKCATSYLDWCVKLYPQQLLKTEILIIKRYFEKTDYKYWSKASLYYLGLRNNDFSFGLTTFYKYSKLLGFTQKRHLQPKIKYSSLKSSEPNEIWCADVTIFKTLDQKKHYIHLLIDHYSKMILGFRIENSSSPKAIKNLLQEAYLKYKTNSPTQFVTDGGIENINNVVKDFITTTTITHLIAQKDIPFSNSQMEAINKILKHQFLLPKQLQNFEQLLPLLIFSITIYNTIRPQQRLLGNTPEETFNGKAVLAINYNRNFNVQKAKRIEFHQNNICKICKYKNCT